MPYSQQKRVLVNSLPKSGTFLLSRAIELFGYKNYAEMEQVQDTPIYFNYYQAKESLRKESIIATTVADNNISVGSMSPIYVSPEHFRRWLSVVPSNDYIVGHISCSPALELVLAELNFSHVFIIRDPRAVLVSLLSFILNTRGMSKEHYLQEDFKLLSVEQRIDFILNGGYAKIADEQVISFIDIYRSMLAWREQKDCLLLRFEDLVGVQGGGSEERQQQAVKKIATHLQQDFDSPIVDSLKKIYNPAAPTFRVGNIDSWKSSLEAETIERLIDYCQPLCKEAGYEH